MCKRLFWLVALWVGANSVSGFTLIGPQGASGLPDGYQVPEIAYFLPGDIGGPKNLGEEYRRNTPDLFWACDDAFLNYFGSNGVVAMEQVVAVINSLTNMSTYSADLNEFALESRRFNYRAQAMNLVDLKSIGLGMLVEELGLLDPERYAWCLRDRRPQPGASCPVMQYVVIQRNFDPITFIPSPYVNGNLFSYQILEICSGSNPLADAVEFNVDPLGMVGSAVASFLPFYGSYSITLSRDDVGGLRYMWRTNNMNLETVSPDSVLAQTNSLTGQYLYTSNLTLLVNQALTNSAAALSALFPNLVVASTAQIPTNIVTTNIVSYLTNFPWSPAGSPPSTAYATNVTTNLTIWFSHQFANVITNSYYTNNYVSVLTTNIGPSPYGPPGILYTNVSLVTMRTNMIGGDYYILPTNSACGVSIINTALTYTVAFTNDVSTTTNAAGVISNSVSYIFYSTNKAYWVYPVSCEQDTVALRQGMDRIKLYRRDYDSLLNRYYFPVTNYYSLYAVTNNQLVRQQFTRVVTAPDVLFSAEERMVPDNAWLGVGFRTIPVYTQATNANPNPGNILGSGTIHSPIVIEFNKVGPTLINLYSPFLPDSGLTEASAFTNIIWGSFDGGTNDPIVYPTGTSITDLENQVLLQVSPVGPALPDARIGINYTNAFGGFTVTGGTAPFNWSLAPGSAGLPSGLSLDASSGKIAGNPTTLGTYDFVVRLTDAGTRFVDRPYSLKVTP